MVLTKAQAKSLDILEVARSLGMEMKRKSHREYYWAEHDSFKIDTVKNTWHWYSQNLFGDTINLVQKMQNVSYKEAMVFLETGSFPEAKPVEEERKPFNYTLAPYEQPFVEARSYLKEIRGLSDDTIDFFLEKGVLAQAKRKDKDGVIEDVLVFKYLDRNQQLVGASLQGLVPDQERHPGKGYLKQIMYQSEAISGLNVSIGSPKRLIVTEAPIDLMSYYELYKGELNDVRLVAMEGLKEGVLSHYVLEILQERGDISMDERDYTKSSELARTSRFLSVAAETSTLFQDHKYDDLITLAVDRDKAGTDFMTKLREKKIPVVDARPPKREGQEKTDWNEILKQEKQLEQTEEIQASSNFPDTSHLSPEDATWLKENWNNISFSVQSTRPSETDPTKEEKYIPGNQEFIANTEENAGRTMSYEEVKRENEALTKELNNRIQSGELSIEFAPDFYLYDVFAKLGNSHPTKYLNDKRMEVLSPIHSLLSSIDDRTVDLYKKKGTPEQDSLYQALKPHQRDLGVDISTRFIGELAIAAYNTNKQIESLSSDSFGIYFDERTLDNLSQSVERMLEYPLIESGTRDFTYGFVVTPNTLFHYLEEQEGEVVLSRELLDNLMSRFETHPIKIMETSEEKAPEKSQELDVILEQQKNERTSGSLGSLQPEAEGSPTPVPKAGTFERSVTSRPTTSSHLLYFTINEEFQSSNDGYYHSISLDELTKLNRPIRRLALQNAAQYYLDELANSKIYYVTPDKTVQVHFEEKHFMHLTGIKPIALGQTPEKTLHDFAEGNGYFDNILLANNDAAFDKLKVLSDLSVATESTSFYFDDLTNLRRYDGRFDSLIKSDDKDIILLFKELEEENYIPISVFKSRTKITKELDTVDKTPILGVFRERDGQIEQLSINDEYVKDGGEEMLSILKNKKYEEVSDEPELPAPENTLNKTSLDSATFTQVLDTVYNLGVPGDISKTPEEFHKAWNQYLDYAKQHNDKFDQIVAAAGADHLLDTNSDFYKEWQQDHIYKENYHVRLQWAEERPDGPKLPFKETELISYQDFARELYKANQSFYQLHQEGLKQVTGGHPEGYISPTKVQFSIYAPDGELIQDSIRYNIGEEINPIAHKERLGTREMREHPELMKIDGTIFTQYHLERLASELDISQFSYALEDTPYAEQLLSQVPYGVLENSPIGFSDSSHDSRLGFISFDGMDSVEVENLSAWFEKLGVKDSPMEQVALVEKWQKEIKGLSEKVEQTISTVREEFEKSQEEEIKLEEQSYNKQELEHDADADGVSDDEELLQGTNPYDFRSKPGSKPEVEESLQADEVILATGSLAVADLIQNKDMAGLSRHLKEGIKEFLDSDKYKDYLTKMSQLNNYSNRNLRLILAQNPEARQVASFKQWKENFDRYVKKGEKALRIFKPMTKIKKDENNQPILDKNGKPETVTFFGLVPVFDVSQTEGKEMPKAAEVKEQLTDLDYANLYRALMAIAKENDVSVRFEEMENNKHGYYSVPENQIVLRSNEMNKAQIIKTFLHEMAHAELHHADNPQKENLTRSTAELQAESVAYVVSSYYGIDTSEYSFNYLSGWSADKETLADLEAQLDIVQQEAKSLMVRMDQALEQLRLSQEKQTKRSFEQKLEKFKDQSKQAVEEHKQELKADAQSKKEKGFSK
ncbi:PBECR4 domain-containing protein [Streptococcus infantis]|uniref:PBECR4 domain-containing protein n=1 Tax=Streptococcus infantis TaxID=68892 RepID=UPI001CBDC4AD|nr:PBECR4 domain-containing protein [Streptococcus infantis]MBZ2120655.1 ssDNA-binding domain-containing protein [Streptococcus infantis]MBZ2122449.1 ssDNA-binding domain-containing protein [Streptococcus infantis]MBZ2125903.1 ssDNA-binding domain-containing protein [Streptococcus infantis]